MCKSYAVLQYFATIFSRSQCAEFVCLFSFVLFLGGLVESMLQHLKDWHAKLNLAFLQLKKNSSSRKKQVCTVFEWKNCGAERVEAGGGYW